MKREPTFTLDGTAVLTIGGWMPSALRVSAALDALHEDVKAVERAREQLDEVIGQRDEAIRDAADSGIGYPALGRITGLSRNRLWTIVNGGRGATE